MFEQWSAVAQVGFSRKLILALCVMVDSYGTQFPDFQSNKTVIGPVSHNSLEPLRTSFAFSQIGTWFTVTVERFSPD